MSSSTSRKWASILVGAGMLASGVLLLLDRAGIMRADRVIIMWPLAFVVAGLFRVFGHKDPRERAFGGALIIVGTLLQLNEFGFHQFSIERIWPFLLILAGIWIVVWGCTKQPEVETSGEAQFDHVSIFGGGEFRISAKNFRGGKLLAIFGGYELDLTQAEIEGDTAAIDAAAVFGGGEIIVPAHWDVMISGTGIFGGYSNETHRPALNSTGTQKTLVVKGVAIFGGVNIRN
ncbi:MAG: DUF5668 domain-containing protein [Candidatus Acidiferrales bacterium]